MSKNSEVLVMGNMSGDMDSIASAVALCSALGKTYLPLINIPRAELFLRKDVVYLFNLLKIDSANLYFREDFPTLLQRVSGVILVDHNVPSPDQEEVIPLVRRIIDHHRDAQFAYPKLENKVIAKTGSNASLILDAIQQKNLSPEIALLLLAPLLLDTSNFQDTRKVTAKDRKALQVLLSCAGALVPSNFYETLLENKLYADPARPDLLLKKDCKLYREGNLTYGISSLPKSIAWTLDNDVHWQEDQLTFLREQKVPLWVILEWLNGGKAVIFTTPSPELKQALVDHIKEDSHLKEVFDLDSFQFQDEFVFYRLKVPLPRKELQPLFSFERILF